MPPTAELLAGSPEPLCSRYDLAMLDLDGVVYIGAAAVPGAPEHLETARAAGIQLAFVTNNASRTPDAVASHLSDLGVAAGASDVVTSAQAAARVLAERLAPGDRVAVLGAEGLLEALAERELEPVRIDNEASAIVTGYAPDAPWREIMHAAVRIRDGLWWVAANSDMTIPTPYGVAPGHGVLVETLRRFTGVDPIVAGKPARPLLDETIRRCGGSRPLMVGDRLDTDIEGAHAVGVDSLLVMTGVTGLSELVAAQPEHRPSFIAADLAGLAQPHPVPALLPSGVNLGGWVAEVRDGRLEISGDGSLGDWWRVAAVASWRHLDAEGVPVRTDGLTEPGNLSP